MSSQGMNLVAAQAGGPAKALAPFRAALGAAQSSFADALPATVRKYLTPERLTKITLAAISRSPQLLECTPESILRSVMDAAQLGLEPGGPLGQAYLVPYRNKGRAEAQLITGYRGLIALARRSGTIESVVAHVVFSRDSFECNLATGILSHAPYMAALPDDAANMTDADIDAACDRGKPITVYCVARFVGGGQHVDVMTMADVERVRRRSKASDSGPWVTDFLEMARKTVVRRAAKYWPLSTELADAMDREDQRAVELAPEKPQAFGFSQPQIRPAPQAEPPHNEDTGEVRDEPPAFDGPDVPDFDSGEPVAPLTPKEAAWRAKAGAAKRAREPGEEG